MKKLFTSTLWLTIFLFAFSQNSKASHIMGTDFSYTCIGGDSFLITLNLFRDCSGISAPNAGFVTFNSSCNTSVSATLVLQNGSSGTEVSQLSPANLANTTCNGGTLPGVQQYIYSGIVVLSSNCSYWDMVWNSCCRNPGVVNIASSAAQSTYISARLYSNSSNCNNSPVFNGIPIPYVCLNQQVNYNVVASEPDGDSLVYSFTSPLGATPAATPLVFQTGYSASSPISGITINSTNGQITFTPTIAGFFVVAVKIDEYEYGTGIHRGTVVRDFQFVVLGSCSNSHPVAPSSITNFSGSATLIGSKTVQACVGNSFDFDLVFTDPDTADSITISSNILDALPGATVTMAQGNPATLSVSWTAIPGLRPVIPLIITAKDDASGLLGFESVVFDVNMVTSTFAGADITICNGTQWAQLNSTGGSTFNWSVLSGSPMDTDPSSSGYNASCTNCANPQFSPNATTTYIVSSNLVGACSSVDTITVAVAPNFDLTMPNDTLICPINSISLPTSTNQSYTYSYQWSASSTLNYDSVSNPVAQPTSPTTYNVTVTSAAGCSKIGDVFVDLADPFPANMFVAGDTVLCTGYSTGLDILDFSGLDSNALSYTWYPTAGLSSSSTMNTTANPSSSTNYNVIITGVNGVCVDTLNFFVDVVSTFDAGFNFTDPYCISASSDVFMPNVGGGTFSGNGITANGVFDPALAGVGSWAITYSIASPASCANDSVINVNVIPLPDASINYIEICKNSTPINLTAINPGGIWSGANIIDSLNGTFNPAGLTTGFYTVYYTLTQPCYNMGTMDIKVIDPYSFTVNPNITVCSGSTIDLSSTYTLSTSASQGSGPVTATFTDANGYVNSSGIFDANGLASGTYSVSLNISDASGNCGTTQNFDVVVLQTDIPQFPNSLSYCDQSTTGIITVVPWLYGTGTTYTQTPIGSTANNLNIVQFGSNGKFNPSTSGNGSWEITVTYTNLNGCTGIMVDTIYVLGTPINTVTQNAQGLTADATGGYTYQWIDCSTNTPIAGETSQTFAPTVAGNYSVVISAGNCSTTSDCFATNAVGIEDVTNELGISMYPNPTSDILNIEKGNNSSVEVNILDYTGKSVYSVTSKNQITAIDVSTFAAGVYLVSIKTENGSIIQKIVKQ